jgi:hypothetical protein
MTYMTLRKKVIAFLGERYFISYNKRTFLGYSIAKGDEQSVKVTFNEGTSYDSIFKASIARDRLIEAGFIVTHEYETLTVSAK